VRPATAIELKGTAALDVLTNDAATGRVRIMNKTANSFFIDTISDQNRFALPAVKGREGGLFSSSRFYHGVIITSALTITQHEQKLTRLAEIAYGQRNIPALERLSAELCSLPSESARDAGMYYAAIIAKRNGQLDFARSMLESLVDSPTFGARATQTLACVFECLGEHSRAAQLHAVAARSSDLFAKFGALIQSSAIRSQAGQHDAALNELQSLWPFVRRLATDHPHLFYTYHNELAYELAQVGRLQEAVRHSEIACASPVANAYTEWQETREGIAAAFVEQEQKPLVFVVPDLQREGKPQHPQVLCACRSFISIRRSPISAAPVMKRSPRAPTIIERISLCVLIHAPPFTSEA
jgi:hypothetical protein